MFAWIENTLHHIDESLDRIKATSYEILNAYPNIITSEEDKNYNTEKFMTGYHEPD